MIFQHICAFFVYFITFLYLLKHNINKYIIYLFIFVFVYDSINFISYTNYLLLIIYNYYFGCKIVSIITLDSIHMFFLHL